MNDRSRWSFDKQVAEHLLHACTLLSKSKPLLHGFETSQDLIA